MSEVVGVEALIRGRVQGVFFRGWTEDEATRRGLSGWVRNNRDGTVTALFVGPRAVVDEILEACRIGPPSARVTAVEVRSVEPPPEVTGFRVVR